MCSFRRLAAIVLLAPLVIVHAQVPLNRTEPAARSAPKQDIKITWLGHAAFELVSAGGTREHLDPVRFLGNRSSGRQGRRSH